MEYFSKLVEYFLKLVTYFLELMPFRKKLVPPPISLESYKSLDKNVIPIFC